MKLIEDDKCPRCGNSFVCSKSGKCWCYEITVTESVKEEIRKKSMIPACALNV
jgi:hypothetical protein